jgi:hypothetical protein
MTIYRITDLMTLKEVQPGEEVTDFRGNPAEFLSVTRYDETAKVEVRQPDGLTHECYAIAVHLRVETL